MLARHALDQSILRITGHDIRLAGNWDPLPGLAEFGPEIADDLGVSRTSLFRCEAIADVLDLMGDSAGITDAGSDEGSLF